MRGGGDSGCPPVVFFVMCSAPSQPALMSLGFRLKELGVLGVRVPG